jgi:putative peptidoglycan lipid II flippase
MGSATLLALGNVASRLLGLVREQVIAAYWGGTLEASAFSAAVRVPTMLYDLLIGGMLSAALVPVLTEYSTARRDSLWRAASVLLSAVAALMAVLAIGVFAFSGPIAALLAGGLGPEGVEIVDQCLRFISPAVLAFGVAGVLTGLLYSLERFTLPAASGAIYNGTFIAVAILLREHLGVYALPLGVALGGTAQVLLLLPGLRDARLRLAIDLHHPALRRVVYLYLPIGVGLLVAQLQVVFDTRLASQAGESALAWMRYATTLIQFPHGLVAVAISLAILPRLAASHVEVAERSYQRILARALRVVAILSLPAAVGLVVLAEPVVGAVFERGAFVATDSQAVILAVYGYALGLPFAAIDWPLNYAFYARQNTLVPAVVGVASVGVYLLVAIVLGPVVNAAALPPDRVFLGLVVADSAKHAFHALTMVALTRRVVGPAALANVGRISLAAAVAAVGMGVVTAALDGYGATLLPADTVGWLVRALAGAAVGLAIYFPLARALGCRDIDWLVDVLKSRLRS